MAKKRRTYTPEFKAEAVKLVTEQGRSVAEAARSLGIREILLRNWPPTCCPRTPLKARPVGRPRELPLQRLLPRDRELPRRVGLRRADGLLRDPVPWHSR